MAEEIIIYDIVDAAIIKSFDLLKAKKLRNKQIKEKAHELSGESEGKIEKRITKLKKFNYLIWHERHKDKDDTKKRWGVYSLNPEYKFEFECKPFLSDVESRSIGITSVQREKHTSDLRAAIDNWIKNFPYTPHLEDTYQKNTYRVFSASTKKCEEHLLFSDLLNHLPESGFEISDRWVRYKNEVDELDKFEKSLIKMIEQNISQIFDKLPIKFVNNSYLESDYQCRIPRLAFDFALEEPTFEIRYSHAVKKARDDQEAYRIYNDLEASISNQAIIDFLPLVEKGDSIIWGDDFRGPHLLRIPKKDKDILMNGMDRALAAISDPSTEISNGIIEIADRLKRLDQEREIMLKELQSSLYCQCFSGDCRYLGSKSG